MHSAVTAACLPVSNCLNVLGFLILKSSVKGYGKLKRWQGGSEQISVSIWPGADQELDWGGSRRISDPAPITWDPPPVVTDLMPHKIRYILLGSLWSRPLCSGPFGLELRPSSLSLDRDPPPLAGYLTTGADVPGRGANLLPLYLTKRCFSLYCPCHAQTYRHRHMRWHRQAEAVLRFVHTSCGVLRCGAARHRATSRIV